MLRSAQLGSAVGVAEHDAIDGDVTVNKLTHRRKYAKTDITAGMKDEG